MISSSLQLKRRIRLLGSAISETLSFIWSIAIQHKLGSAITAVLWFALSFGAAIFAAWITGYPQNFEIMLLLSLLGVPFISISAVTAVVLDEGAS